MPDSARPVWGEGLDSDTLDAFEERAAISEYDGGQYRAAAEAAALAETASTASITPRALQRLWAAHPDAWAYLDFLRLHGPATYGAAASMLGWEATRAWKAEARLRAAGLVLYREGKAASQ